MFVGDTQGLKPGMITSTAMCPDTRLVGFRGQTQGLPTAATRRGDEHRDVPVHQFWQVEGCLLLQQGMVVRAAMRLGISF